MVSLDAARMKNSQGGNPLSERDPRKQHDVSDAVSLRALVHKKLEESKWVVRPNPCLTATSVKYSFKPDYATLAANGLGYDVSESKNDVGGNQEGHVGERALVDMVATCGSRLALCVGTHWLDPTRVSWVFTSSDLTREGVSAIYRICSEQRSDDLLHSPGTRDRVPSSIRMGEYNLRLETHRYAQGQVFKKHNNGVWKLGGSLLDVACQIARETFCVAEEYLKRPGPLDKNRWEQWFMPTIVINANIVSREVDKNNQTVRHVQKNAVVYDCPISMSRVDSPMCRTAMWSILIVNLRGLDELRDKLWFPLSMGVSQ